MKKKTLYVTGLLIAMVWPLIGGKNDGNAELILNKQTASEFARLALECIAKEYPNKISHVLGTPSDIQGPKGLHPAFYGCFDWHSAVHGHWTLVKLLKLFPRLPQGKLIRTLISDHINRRNIAGEVIYFSRKGRQSFERTYGWAWLLKLAAELYTWDDPDGKRWCQAMYPLELLIVNKYLDFLPKQTYPIRTGVHPNTAFGLAFALDYARAVQNQPLIDLITNTGLRYYKGDRNCPVGWEPGGEDFFSPCLMEAFFMQKILSPGEFQQWFRGFMPDFFSRHSSILSNPAVVTDRTDGKLVHLDGLNLSRAWCFFSLAGHLPVKSLSTRRLIEAGKRHALSSLGNMKNNSYAGGHWLGTFAVYMFSEYRKLTKKQ